VGVVDRLEAVEIEAHDPQTLARIAGAGNQTGKLDIGVAPITQARQRNAPRGRLRSFEALVALGDVALERNPVGEPAGAVCHRRA
jgi:hypothetical protein